MRECAMSWKLSPCFFLHPTPPAYNIGSHEFFFPLPLPSLPPPFPPLAGERRLCPQKGEWFNITLLHALEQQLIPDSPTMREGM